MSRIDFRASSHQYRLDGQLVPGVTTITGLLPKGNALVQWSANETAAFAASRWAGLDVIGAEDVRTAAGHHRHVSKSAAEKGSLVHSLVERLLRGETVDPPSPEVARLLRSALAFMDEWHFEPILTETIVWDSGMEYAGTFDLVGTSPRFPGRVFLCDWKTGRGIYGEAAVQLAAYASAEHYVDGGEDRRVADLGITDHLVIHLREDGYSAVPARRDHQVFDLFATLRRLYRLHRSLDSTLLQEPLELEEVPA